MGYANGIPKKLIAEAKENNLVIISGGSDDLVELRGAIYDESGAWDGGTLKAIRALLADLYRRPGGFNPVMPMGRMMGGPVQYHSFGNFISSGVVPHPSGAAARDAAGMQKGTDTYAATVPSGSFVLNRAASQMFGHKYLSGGGVAAMLTPGEIVLSPQQVAKHGLANVTRDNQLGRMVQRRQIGGPVYASGGAAFQNLEDSLVFSGQNAIISGQGLANRGGNYADRTKDTVRFRGTGTRRGSDRIVPRGIHQGDQRNRGEGYSDTSGWQTVVSFPIGVGNRGGRVTYAQHGFDPRIHRAVGPHYAGQFAQTAVEMAGRFNAPPEIFKNLSAFFGPLPSGVYGRARQWIEGQPLQGFRSIQLDDQKILADHSVVNDDFAHEFGHILTFFKDQTNNSGMPHVISQSAGYIPIEAFAEMAGRTASTHTQGR